MGGSADMEQTAVAVAPLRDPSSFKVVMTQTLAASRRIPALNRSADTVMNIP